MVGIASAARAGRLMAILGTIAVTLTAAVTAMLTVTAIAITPQRHLEQLLPANTLLYVTVDSLPDQIPSGPLEIAHTAVGAMLRKKLHVPLDAHHAGQCVSQASQAMSNLPHIGQGTAIALLPFPPSERGRLAKEKHVKKLVQALLYNSVVIAPLDVELTLPEALTAHSQISGVTPLFTYHGVKIFRAIVGACSAIRAIPTTYYAAAFDGYILLAADKRALKIVVETGLGRRRSLGGNRAAGQTPPAAKPGQVGMFYVNAGLMRKWEPELSHLLRSMSLTRRIPEHGTANGAVILGQRGSVRLTSPRAGMG